MFSRTEIQGNQRKAHKKDSFLKSRTSSMAELPGDKMRSEGKSELRSLCRHMLVDLLHVAAASKGRREQADLDSGDGIMLCREGVLSCACRIFTGIQGLYPSHSSSNTPRVTIKNVSRCGPNVPGDRIAPPTVRTTGGHVCQNPSKSLISYTVLLWLVSTLANVVLKKRLPGSCFKA